MYQSDVATLDPGCVKMRSSDSTSADCALSTWSRPRRRLSRPDDEREQDEARRETARSSQDVLAVAVQTSELVGDGEDRAGQEHEEGHVERVDHALQRQVPLVAERRLAGDDVAEDDEEDRQALGQIEIGESRSRHRAAGSVRYHRPMGRSPCANAPEALEASKFIGRERA
jgi:hypothetical protein